MNVEYLWDHDCHGCLALKHHDIPDRFRRVIEALPDVNFDSCPIGRETEYLEIENGQITEKSVVLGNGLHEFADRRPDDYSGLGTPMLHLVDPYPSTRNPTIGEYSESEDVVYEEIFFSNLLEEEMTALQKTWENDCYGAGHEVDRVPKPALAARMVMKRVFRFYRYNLLDTPEHTREEFAQLEPERESGNFDTRGWTRAFERLYEV